MQTRGLSRTWQDLTGEINLYLLACMLATIERNDYVDVTVHGNEPTWFSLGCTFDQSIAGDLLQATMTKRRRPVTDGWRAFYFKHWERVDPLFLWLRSCVPLPTVAVKGKKMLLCIHDHWYNMTEPRLPLIRVYSKFIVEDALYIFMSV